MTAPTYAYSLPLLDSCGLDLKRYSVHVSVVRTDGEDMTIGDLENVIAALDGKVDPAAIGKLRASLATRKAERKAERKALEQGPSKPAARTKRAPAAPKRKAARVAKR